MLLCPPVIFISDVEDNYSSVGLKLASAFQWISAMSLQISNSWKWILKLDDDVILNLSQLENFVHRLQSSNNTIYCHVYQAEQPFRNNETKWFVPQDSYPYKFWPPYCQGPFYLFHIHVAKKLGQSFEAELNRNYVWPEDSFITGILPLLNDIQLQDISDKICSDIPWIMSAHWSTPMAIITSHLDPLQRLGYFQTHLQALSINTITVMLQRHCWAAAIFLLIMSTIGLLAFLFKLRIKPHK